MHDFKGKIVFVTGGTGTIGQSVVDELVKLGAIVRIYSRDQNKQFVMANRLKSVSLKFINGDICDLDLLLRSMKGSDYVVHCAASKHVPLCETNVDSSIKINVEGTRNVLLAATRNSVKKFLQLSTDKAVNPVSVMGMTKALAERLVLEFNSEFASSCVRLGNVFASNGSVIPTFRENIKRNEPLVVNNPDASRFFLTQQACSKFIVSSLSLMKGGEIFIPKMKWLMIDDLAKTMRPSEKYPIVYRDMLFGEKLDESLFSEKELNFIYECSDYWVIRYGSPSLNTLSYSDVHKNKSWKYTQVEIRELLEHV